MYIKNDIAYADEQIPLIKICGIRPLSNYRLWVRFENGEKKIVDLSGLLEFPLFAPLKEQAVFESVFIERGLPIWKDGEISVAPEYLYAIGVESESMLNR